MRYETTFSYRVSVEADTKEEAEEKACGEFSETIDKAISAGDNPADWMTVETKALKKM